MNEIEAEDNFEELPVESVTEPGVRIEKISPNLERIIVDGVEIFASNDAAILRKVSNEAPVLGEPSNSQKLSNEVLAKSAPAEAGADFNLKKTADALIDSLKHQKISGESPPKKNPARNARKRPISGASIRSSVELDDAADVKIELPELSGDDDEELSDGGRTTSSISSASRRLTRQSSRSQTSPTEASTRSGKGSRSASAAASKEQAASSKNGGMRLRLRMPTGTPSKAAPSTPHGARTPSSRAHAADGSTSKAGSRELRSGVSDGNSRELRPRRAAILKIDEDEFGEEEIEDIIDEEPLFSPSTRPKGVSLSHLFMTR